MYKMGEVCERTGLSEKAIRLYMEQKLVEPNVEEGVHRKTYTFSEEDIERLKDVSALRNAGFSIAEIRKMLENPANISALVAERQADLEKEIRKKTVVQDALRHLTIQEHSNITKLADAVEPRSAYMKETPKKRLSRKKKWVILLGIIFFVFVWLSLAGRGLGVCIVLISFGLVFGLIAMVSALRYILHSKKARTLTCQGKGRITAIVRNEKIEEYIGKRERSTLKELFAYLAFGMFGEGIWESLRPDCWYPVIVFEDTAEQIQMATLQHGGFKNNWKVGEEIAIAWEEGKEQLVYPCKGQYLRKKAIVYFVLGLIMIGLAGVSARHLLSGDTISRDKQSASEIWQENLERIENADRITIFCQNHLFELSEEESNVLMTQLRELSIEEGKRHFGIAEGYTIRFYQEGKEIERYTVGDFFYITTGYGMRYKVNPIVVELDGTMIEDTTYITGFLLRFTEKLLLEQAIEEMLGKIVALDDVNGLQELLANERYYDGAVDLGNGYRFKLSENGFRSYWDNTDDKFETGDLVIRFQEENVLKAELTISYLTKEGNVETYIKEW